MNILLNVPSVSQLTTVTDEAGEISNNAQQDCTAAGIDALCRFALGTPENSIFNPDNMKDHAYGDAYIGGTAAVEYVSYCKSLGVILSSVTLDSPAQAIADARHIIVSLQQPCVFTRDDPYVDPVVHPGWTHVCYFVGADDAGLTAHDPYIDKRVYKTDATWAALLRSNDLWFAKKEGSVNIPTGWTDDGTTLTAPNGVQVQHAFRDYILNNAWDKDNYPLGPEYGTQRLEDSNPGLGGGEQLMCRMKLLGYTPERGVFEEWGGVELAYARQQMAKAYTTLQQMQAQIDALKAVSAPASQEHALLQQVVTSAKALGIS